MALDVVDSEGYVAPPTKDVQGLASAAPRKFVEKWTYFFTHPHISAAPTGLISTAATT